MQELPSVIVNQTNNKSKLIFLALFVLLLGFLLGFGVNRFLFSKKTQTSISTITQSLPQNIDESKLPISLPLLQNPMVYEWRGSVQGKLTDKKEHFFTLTDENGRSITITDITPTGEIFKAVYYEKTKLKWKEISLNDIPIGSILLGDFFIFKNGKNTPVGSLFKIDK